MATPNWQELRQLINDSGLGRNGVISTTKMYDDYMSFIFTEKERSANVLYIQKEINDGEVYFVLHGDSIDGAEEFATINDAAAWVINLVTNIKFVYLPYDGEDINDVINDPNLELTLNDDGESYKMTVFNVTLTFFE